MVSSVLSYLTGIAVALVPLLAITIIAWLAPSQRRYRNYGSLVALSLLGWFPSVYLSTKLGQIVDPISNFSTRVIVHGITFGIGNILSEYLPFYLWLAGLRQRILGDYLLGAAISSLTSTTFVYYYLLNRFSSDFDIWAHHVLTTSVLMLSVAIEAIAVGLWTALAAKAGNPYNFRVLMAALAAVTVSAAFWSMAILTQKADLVYLWVPLAGLTAAIRIGLVASGVHALMARGERFRTPSAT